MLRFFCRTLVSVVLLLVCCFTLRGQNYSVYNSWYVNPYLYNPAEAATDYAYAFANYRRQWLNVPGAPALSTLNLNTLIDQSRAGIGVKLSSYRRGLLNTNEAMVTYAYGVPVDKNNIVFFGISGGLSSNTLDISQIADLSDPALAGVQANNMQPAANFGIKWTSSSGINFGAVLPRLLGNVYNPGDLSTTGRMPFDNMIFTFSYKKKLEGGIVNKTKRGMKTRVKTGTHYAPLEFHALYRYSSAGNNQLEVVAKVNVSDNFWLAASYRQQYGFIASTGFAYQRFMLCYSYEPGGQPQKGFSMGGHEVQLGIRLSDEKKFKFKVPVLQSSLKKQEEQHNARYRHQTIDDVVGTTPAKVDKKYYVIVNAFNDFEHAEAYKKKLIEQKYNAEIFYYPKDKHYYIYTFVSTKASEANEEVKNLKSLTKLKTAKVLIVTDK